MGTLYINPSNPIYIYPWGNAHGVVMDALSIIEDELRGLGIDVLVRTGAGPRLLSGNHVNGRGWWDGRDCWLHSGKVPNGPGYQAPFKGPEQMGTIILHEWMHSQGWQHRPGGAMDPNSGRWPAPWEVKWFKQKFGEIKDPMQQLREERQKLVKQMDQITKRIKEIDRVLDA